jgi:hypothetical protein
MNAKQSVWYVIAAIIYLAIIMLLVRPSSKGPQLIGSILDALTNLIQGTTGYGTQTS